MTIKHILNKINIHITTYIIILLSFLSGYFEIVFLTILSITIHELGHFLTASLLKLKVSEIKIFMFGGVTILDENLTIDIKKELLTLIMGPLTQILFSILIFIIYKNGNINIRTWNLFLNINILLLSFNLLPVLPLDGGKLINNLLDTTFSYNISHKISIIISLLTIPLIFKYDKKLFACILIFFLIIKNIEEITTHKYRIMKLITERKLKFHKYKKIKQISNIKNIYRNKNFKIKINNLNLNEQDYFKYIDTLSLKTYNS